VVFRSEKKKKKNSLLGYKKIYLLLVLSLHVLQYSFFFFLLFFFGNHFLEFLIKIIFIKKSTVTLFNGNIIISFSIFKDPNDHIFQRSYSFSINRTISYL
jgi:hypothetical protein